MVIFLLNPFYDIIIIISFIFILKKNYHTRIIQKLSLNNFMIIQKYKY